MELNITVSRVAGGSYAIGTMNLAPYKRQGGRGRGGRSSEQRDSEAPQESAPIPKPERVEKKAVPPPARPPGYIPGGERIIPGMQKDKKKNPKKKNNPEQPPKSDVVSPVAVVPPASPSVPKEAPLVDTKEEGVTDNVEELVEKEAKEEVEEKVEVLEKEEKEEVQEKEEKKEEEKNGEETLPTTTDNEDTKKQETESHQKEEEQKAKTESDISKPVTIQLSRPLGQEIITGQQTFILIDGSLYLKVNPVDPKVKWYTSLQKEVDLALHPPPPPPPPMQAKKVCQYQKVEKNNGSLVFVVDVPDFVKENVQKKGNVTKKKKK